VIPPKLHEAASSFANQWPKSSLNDDKSRQPIDSVAGMFPQVVIYIGRR
jgi:hypothetical protein